MKTSSRSFLSIEKKEFVSSFQEAIRGEYPILKPEQTQGLIFSSQGVVQTTPQITWRFTDLSGDWRVSLAPNFLALETTKYSGRTNFIRRLKNIVEALENSFNPGIIERFGLRYVNRLTDENFQDISLLIKPEIAGITVTSELKQSVRETINQSLFITSNSEEVLTRWGLMPSGRTFDPNAIEAITKDSWIIDLDMSLSKNREFEVKALIEEATQYSERLYTFFLFYQ